MEKVIFEKEFKALGTDIYIQLIEDGFGVDKARRDFETVENIYKEQEKILSRFNKESELSRLNNNLGFFKKASTDLIYLSKKSLDYYALSRGFFDPRILDTLDANGYRKNFKENDFESLNRVILKERNSGSLKEDLILRDTEIKFLRRMDFSGIAKGYITDKVASLLAMEGWKNFLVDSGGDMYLKGKNKREEKWGIALEGFINEEEIVMEVSDEGLATSGNTRKKWKIGDKKMHHLINPFDENNFNFNLKTVTVIAESTERADVLAKILFLMGLEAGMKFANENNIKCIFLKSDKTIVKSKMLN